MTLHIHHYPSIREFCDFVGGSGVRVQEPNRYGGWSTTDILKGLRGVVEGRHVGVEDAIDWPRMNVEVEKAGRLVDATFDRPRRGWVQAPMGAYPIVPEVLMGHPTPMRIMELDPSEQAPMRLVLDSSVAIAVSRPLMSARGFTITALVTRLMETRPVQVDVCFAGRVTHAHPYLANQAAVVSLAPEDVFRQSVIMVAGGWFPLHLGPLAAIIHAKANPKISGIDPLWGSQRIDDRYALRVRQALNLGHGDLYIPPGRHVDVQALLTNPGRWLRDAMNQQE